MFIDDKISDALGALFKAAAERQLEGRDYEQICKAVGVSKLYYDMDLGDSGRYRDAKTRELVISGIEVNGNIVLYDDGTECSFRRSFTYYYDGQEFVHAYIDLQDSGPWEKNGEAVYSMLADIIYVIVSRANMRNMLDFAETTDAQTGIPNVIFITRKFNETIHSRPDQLYSVLYFNLQNFKYINETATAKCGDEAIIKYAHTVVKFVEDDECVCRMGGDNFAMFIRREHLSEVIEKLHSVVLSKLENAPGRSFEISAWIGVSEGNADDRRPFSARLNESAMACGIGKSRLKQNVVFYSEELKLMMNRGREIMAMFMPAVKNREFHPFFQPKVNMETGELVGFEALCRWIHDGRFIFPDQFIPILDKEGLIHDLDMAIFRETCAAIKQWKDMGLMPPRISSNFSRKNLFIPHIEQMIYDTIVESGIDVNDVEIEITESVQEAETTRLIEFVRNLKNYGLHISIDDFGTGYSSLMLIHNIDADILKIDKSFVDEIPGDHKSEVLIESIINIAQNLDMSLIAEGVETAEQGRELIRLGCSNAQGYFYSKPVDYDAATEMIRTRPFKAIV